MKRIARWFGPSMLVPLAIGGPTVALACSMLAPPEVRSVPGLVDGFWNPVDVDVPANFVVFRNATALVPALGSFTETTSPEPGCVSLTPAPVVGDYVPLQTGATGTRLHVVDYLDVEAPTAPTIVAVHARPPTDGGCRTTCDAQASTQLVLTSATDDFTPSAHLTYAVYVGATEAQVDLLSAAHVATRLLASSSDGTRESLWWTGDSTGHFVALEAIDQAGHHSPRTAAFYVAPDGAGCRTATAHPVAQAAPLALALVALRRFRRRSTPG